MNRAFYYVLISVIIFSLAACGDTSKPVNSPAATGMDTVPVFLLSQKQLAKKIELPAELMPYEQVDLLARVPGYIKDVKVDIGDRVRKGQIIAIIEAPEVNTQYEEFQTALLGAKAKYQASLDNYQRLLKASQASTPGIVAPVDLERNKQQMLADSASYSAAEKLALSYKEVSGFLVLKAPFNGVVTARKADPGNLAGANSSIVTIQNNSVLRLRIAVPETYIDARPASDTISFRMDAFPEKSFAAKLARKSETIDPVTRTELWEYDYNNRSNMLKSGAFAYVQFNLSRTAKSFIVPASSIATTQEKKFVIRVKNSKAEWVDIRQGMSTDAGIEIFGNLTNQDTLLSRATDERKPGSTAFWKITGPAKN